MVYLTFLLVRLYTMKHTANVKNNLQPKEGRGDFWASLEVCFLLFMGEDFIRLCYGSPPNVRYNHYPHNEYEALMALMLIYP
jgi:hypothetical protein